MILDVPDSVIAGLRAAVEQQRAQGWENTALVAFLDDVDANKCYSRFSQSWVPAVLVNYCQVCHAAPGEPCDNTAAEAAGHPLINGSHEERYL